MKFGGTIRVNRLGVCLLLCLVILGVVYLAPRAELPYRRETVDLKRLLVAAVQAARRGGRQVVRARAEPDLNSKSKGKTREGADSLVTNADYRSHCVMYYGITAAFPNLKVISEEKTKEKECKDVLPLELDDDDDIPGIEKLQDEEVDSSKITVWIDPLDATQEYTENILNCVTTMVCIAYEGIPVIGVIHKPFGQEPTNWAWINRGISPSLESLRQKIKAEKNDSKTFIVSRSHSGDVIKVIKEKFGEGTEIVQSGGAGFKILEVIAGHASAYVHVTAIKKWDICAGDAIITALKGRLSTLSDKDLEYSADLPEVNEKGVIASMHNHNVYVMKLMDVLQ